MRRFWPSGVASRVALILLLGLLVLQAVSMLLYARERAQATFRVFAESVADRIVAVTELMETTSPVERPPILRAVNSPTLFVQILDTRPEALGAPHRVDREVRRYLRSLGDRPVQIDFAWRRHARWRDHDHDHDEEYDEEERYHDDDDPWPTPDLLPSREKLAISVGLRHGDWVRFVVSSEETSLLWAGRMAFWVTLTASVIALFAWWAARRVTALLHGDR